MDNREDTFPIHFASPILNSGSLPRKTHAWLTHYAPEQVFPIGRGVQYVHYDQSMGETKSNLWSMTKKRSSGILVDENRNFFGENLRQSLRNFSEIGGI